MDISWTWLGIVVLALIIFACASGFRRGFVKEIVSAFFMIISFLLVWVINPYVNTFVREYTPVYNIVQSFLAACLFHDQFLAVTLNNIINRRR